MIALPIPLIVSFTTLYLLIRMMLRGTRFYLFIGLLAACAVQGVLISLVHHYGVKHLFLFIPITASLIPPLAWLAFRHSLIAPFRWPLDGIHLLVPVFTAFCVLFARVTVDAVLSLNFTLYGGAILWVLSRNDSLPLARLDAGQIPVFIWRALAIALLLSAATDVLIAAAIAFDYANFMPWIVSSFSSCSLLAIAILGLMGESLAPPNDQPEPVKHTKIETRQDQDLMARLDEVIQNETLYLDPDLTLTRMAKRLHVPIKQLSSTINRHTGENVSRYINAHRIRHACALMQAGDTITSCIYASGFNTKSNFNREFLRVTGATPRDWQQIHCPE